MYGDACVKTHCVKMYKVLEMYVWRCMCKDAPCEDVPKCWRCMHGGACVNACAKMHYLKMYKVLEMYVWRCMCKCMRKNALSEDVQSAGDVCMEVHV